MRLSKSTGFVILNKNGKPKRFPRPRRIPTRKDKRSIHRRLTREELKKGDPLLRPDWSSRCELCGPCTFGEAETADGNW